MTRCSYIGKWWKLQIVGLRILSGHGILLKSHLYVWVSIDLSFNPATSLLAAFSS